MPITSQGQGLLLNDILHGINEMTERLKTDRLKVLRGGGADLWLARREAYLWAPDPKTLGETLLQKPAPGIAEHVMDATRYLCVGLRNYSHGPSSPSVQTRHQAMTSRGVVETIRQ